MTSVRKTIMESWSLYTVQKLRKVDLYLKNESVAFLQHDICILPNEQ